MTHRSQMAPDSNPFASHPRSFEQNRYVYPVVSRRAGGLSIGVNLNPDKVCNFHCIYCQVDRQQGGATAVVDLDRLARELDITLDWALTGRLFELPQFASTPQALRRLNDIALSGDGEPTASRQFEQVVALCAEVRQRRCLDQVKLVLITNASLLDREPVQRALARWDTAGGEIWAKLDAGTETYYRLVARTAVPFQRILDNLLATARLRPIVIQSLFAKIHGQAPPEAEIHAYCDRLSAIVAAGGRIQLVQVHTVARPPAENWVLPLENAQLDQLAEQVRQRTGLRVATFYAP